MYNKTVVPIHIWHNWKCSSLTLFNCIFMCIKWCIKNGYPLYTGSAVFFLSLNWCKHALRKRRNVRIMNKAVCFCWCSGLRKNNIQIILLHNFVKQILCKCVVVACNFKQVFVFAFLGAGKRFCAVLSFPSCNVCFTFELLS